jgi:hypothetical protein
MEQLILEKEQLVLEMEHFVLAVGREQRFFRWRQMRLRVHTTKVADNIPI